MDSDASGAEIHVVVVPLFAQSHMNQLLHLCTAIAGRGISVSFVATSTHIQQVRTRFQGTDPRNFNVRFEELAEIPDGEPSAESKHMFPTHLASLFDCGDILLPQMDTFLCKISSSNSKRVVMVYDMHMGWVQPVADKYEIPAYVFIPVGVYPMLWFTHKRTGADFGAHLGFSSLQVPLLRTISEQHLMFVESQEKFIGPAKGTIFNTFRAIEAPFVDLAEEKRILGEKPVWTVGPLLPHHFLSEELPVTLDSSEYCTIRWLDDHSPASVLYVSFGSVSSLPAAQIREVAVGLERSGQPFLWVLRASDTSRFSPEADSNGNEICEFLPEGYESRIRGRGLVVTKWAPQLQILFHKSTGGFLTHCGWNSTVESVCAGVPVVAWPLHSDQFANAKLLTCELKIGVEVKEWSDRQEYEMVSAEEVEMAVKRLMVSEEGVQMREKAKDLRAQTRVAVAAGGSSSGQFDSLLDNFYQQISRNSVS